MNRLRRHASLLSLLLLASTLAHPATAQRAKRDHLTPQEVELVRDAQELDARSGVFIKAVERRLRIIFNQSAPDTKQEKQIAEALGALPQGTRAELLYDIAHILDEAIENVDDTAQRNPKSSLLPKSVRKLSEASTRFLAQLTPLRTSITDKAEREQLEQAIDNAQQIVEAAKKLPAEETKEKPGKKG
jgi:predicted nucleotidyltransferase component of viral defense system